LVPEECGKAPHASLCFGKSAFCLRPGAAGHPQNDFVASKHFGDIWLAKGLSQKRTPIRVTTFPRFGWATLVFLPSPPKASRSIKERATVILTPVAPQRSYPSLPKPKGALLN
jgi:hypothetical protein